jgi:hypothetical protein
MPESEWGLDLPDEDDLRSGGCDSPLDDQQGEPCIARHCVDCGQEFLMNLYLAERMSEDSSLCKCPACLGLQIRLGGERVRARDAKDASRDEGEGA